MSLFEHIFQYHTGIIGTVWRIAIECRPLDFKTVFVAASNYSCKTLTKKHKRKIWLSVRALQWNFGDTESNFMFELSDPLQFKAHDSNTLSPSNPYNTFINHRVESSLIYEQTNHFSFCKSVPEAMHMLANT